jgi:hypothetical protein
MSNKKLFWIAFFILSCCEFGQVAYSKNISASNQTLKTSGTGLQCHEEKALGSVYLLNGKLASYSLPH